MKKILYLLEITAFTLVITFVMTACATDNNGDIGGPSYLGEDPTLSGKVYEYDFDEENMKFSYKEFKGNMTFSIFGLTKTGTITNGEFSIILGTPYYLNEISYDIRDIFHDYDDLTFNPNTTKGNLLVLYNYENHYALSKENSTVSGTRANYNGTSEHVEYYYVDKDVTISGNGKTTTYSDTEDGITYSEKSTTKDINLELKAGWNAIYFKYQVSGYMTENTEIMTSTTTVSLGNPNLKWVLKNGK